MGWKMMQQRIWKLIILCVILSTLDVPGSTGFVPPSQEEAAVGDGPTTEPQSDGFLQPPLISPILKSPPVGQTVKGPAPVLAPSESSTLPLQDSAPPPSSISPHVSPPPSPILEVPPHASLPLPPMLGLPPALAPPPPILEVPPHASAPFTPIQIVPPQASTPPPPNLPNASTPPPPIPVVPPDSTPPPPPMDAVPPHAIIPPPPIVEVPPHAFALVPPIAIVPPHAPTPPPPNPALPPHAYTPPPPIPVRSPLSFAPPPPIQATLPHASTPPPPIQATLPHASTPPPPIQTMPPHASTPLPSILATPPVAYIPPPPILEVPPHASAPFTPIQIVPPQASTSPPPNLPNASTLPPPIPVVPLDSTPPPPPMDAVPPHAIIPPAPFVEVPPHAFALAPPIAVVPPHAPTPPPPNPALPPHAYTPPPPIPVRSPLAFAPPPPIQAMLPHASTPPPPIQTMPPHASTPLPPILATPPVAYIPPPPIVVVPPHAFAPPSVDVPPHAQPSPNLAVPSHPYVPPSPILVEAPFSYASPPPILAVPPHASSPPSHTLPTHDPPVPPNVLAPPHNSVPAQPLPAMPTPTSLPIPISVLPPINNSVPSHSALPQTPSAPPPLSPRPSSRHSAPPLPLGPLNPNVSSPRHTSRPPTSPVAPLAPQPSLGLPTRALSPTSSVVSPTPNALAPPHHALPQAPIVPPRTLSPPPSRSPPLVLAPSVPAMPLYPNASAPPRTSPPSPPLVPPLSPAQPPSKLSRKASSPPLIVVSEPPKISSLSNKPRPLHPTMSPLGSGQPPSRLPVQILAPTPSTLPLPQNVSTPPHNFPPVLPTVPPLDSAQAPSRLPLQTSPPPPAAMPIPPNVSAPPMHVMGQHASAPKQVAGSLSPQASPAPRSTKPSDASSPPASVVDQGNVPSISPLTSRPQGQYRHHKASPSVAAAPGFSPNRAPSAVNSTIHTNSDPSPAGAALPSPETSPSESFPAASPSTSYVKHQFPRNNISSPAPETSGGSESPPYAPQSLNRHTHPSIRHAGSSEANIPSPSPLATGNINLAPPLPLIAPSGHSEIPSVSPEISPSRASTNNQTRPLAIPIIALPPPPPNEDCAYLTCTEPLTNTPPGSPCGCVYPMQVRLRLSVDLYTFFPQVLELAREIAAGVFMKQSQVRIMGANAAIQQPEKTDVLIYLVPLGEKFDNVTAFLTFQRFWHKQVSIDKSVFGDYEVLYVHYSGLPPSPPVASSDMAVTNSKPGSGQDASGVHPLAADVSRQRRKHGLSGVLIAVIVFSAAAAMLLCLSIAWVLLVRRRKNVPRKPNSHAQISSLTRHSGTAVHSGGSGPSSASLSLGSSIAAYTGSAKTFSISEIEKATDKFNPSKVLGEGGFGLVYSGILEDGTKIAVKVLKRDDQQGGREFFAEVEMLSRLHHRNLVKLIGICVEERTRCLVYELVPNGSVESHLHGIDRETSPLEWATRMKIALGAARGLAYLHEDSSPRVIHRDFKASNILLENDFTPKVSDFGLARTGMEEESRHISTRVMGTFGYVAPEYAMTGHLLVKSDVYSYGVVLLELLTGRKPVDMSQPTGQENLVAWTRPLLTSREGLESIIDPSLGQNVSYNSIAKVAAIASMCVQPEVSHRPFMGEVVQALKLVCNECEDTKDDESIRTSCSHENFSSDFDPRMSPVSGEMLNPTQSELTIHNYVSGHDLEKGVSVSDIFGASEMLGRQASGSSRRHSASGPMRVGRRDRWFWHKSWRSGGSVSENDIMHKFWSGSH